MAKRLQYLFLLFTKLVNRFPNYMKTRDCEIEYFRSFRGVKTARLKMSDMSKFKMYCLGFCLIRILFTFQENNFDFIVNILLTFRVTL